LSGVEATSCIVKDHPMIRVIGYTMHAEKSVFSAMLDAGAAACISKSAPIQDLLSAIHNCVPRSTKLH
jgi:DNA-binding NarL/FixJ family response regulator